LQLLKTMALAWLTVMTDDEDSLKDRMMKEALGVIAAMVLVWIASRQRKDPT
jgi:hypothetical protein